MVGGRVTERRWRRRRTGRRRRWVETTLLKGAVAISNLDVCQERHLHVFKSHMNNSL